MSNDDLQRRVHAVFQDILHAQPQSLHADARRGELPGWDSMAHIDLVAELETRFSITIEPDLALEIETIGDACRIVASLMG